MERAKAQAEKADLLIHMVDASRPLAQEEDEIFHILQGKRAVILMNKSDLTAAVDAETVREKAPGRSGTDLLSKRRHWKRRVGENDPRYV